MKDYHGIWITQDEEAIWKLSIDRKNDVITEITLEKAHDNGEVSTVVSFDTAVHYFRPNLLWFTGNQKYFALQIDDDTLKFGENLRDGEIGLAKWAKVFTRMN